MNFKTSYVRLLLAFIICIIPGLISAQEIKMIFLKGDVTVKRENTIIETKDIKANDVIKVGANSLAILKNNAETIKIVPNTEIIYLPTSTETVVQLNAGGVISQIHKKKFKVNTKSVAFGVRGTQFFTSVDDKNQAWMCVNEGEVEVINEKQTPTIVTKGKGVFVANGKTTPPKTYQWTKEINWGMDGLTAEPNIKIETSYEDILDFDYD